MPTDTTIQLHDAILDLFHHALVRFPPSHAPDPSALAPNSGGRLGAYLVQLGYITPRQLARALHSAGDPIGQRAAPLGCALVAQDLVPPRVVAAILLQQFLDRLEIDRVRAPRYLGEQLLVEAQLEPAQLALVLEEQLESYQHGGWMRLGNLIVQHGWLDTATITTVVERMRRQAPN
jgi:hypothetical protein